MRAADVPRAPQPSTDPVTSSGTFAPTAGLGACPYDGGMPLGGCRAADRYEIVELRLGFAGDMRVLVPEGSLPSARAILDMLAPPKLQPREYPQRAYAHASDWLIPEKVSLAAIAALPRRTREDLETYYPAVSKASKAHVAEQVHAHCAAELTTLDEAAAEAGTGFPTLGVGNGATAAQVGNALAARHVLDAVFGDQVHTRIRYRFLGAALRRYENGDALDHTPAGGLDAQMLTVSTQPETDYLAAEQDVREKALAHLLVRGLSQMEDVPAPGLARRGERLDRITEFALSQLENPLPYARAVRRLQTFDPARLQPALHRISGR